jgi:dCMP deaminase
VRPENTLTNSGSNVDRPSWDDYFFEIADSVSKRATCDRGKSGCALLNEVMR